MNILKGNIDRIKVSGDLSIVEVKVGELVFSIILIDTPESADFLKIKNDVRVIFKETEVILGVGDMSGVSLRNKIKGKVSHIESDALLSKVTIETEIGPITSVITTGAVKQLGIEKVILLSAMIKTNELMLSK